MIRIGILGDIGSGKTFVSKNFGFPVFNADIEVNKLYDRDKKIFNKLKKKLPKYFYSFPINKKEVINAILGDEKNLKKIVQIVHKEIRKNHTWYFSGLRGLDKHCHGVAILIKNLEIIGKFLRPSVRIRITLI